MRMPEQGTFDNVMAGGRALTVTEKGNLEFQMICLLEDETQITAYLYIMVEAGQKPNETTINSLKESLGWDGVDLEWLVNSEDMPQFQIVVEDEEYNGKVSRKVKWINPNNASGGGSGLKSGDISAIKAKFGMKLRALSGGKTVPKKTPAAPAAPTAPATAPDVPAASTRPPRTRRKPAKTSTADECWDALQKAMPTASEDEITAKWQKVIETTGKDSDDLTSEEWGGLLNACVHGGDELPF